MRSGAAVPRIWSAFAVPSISFHVAARAGAASRRTAVRTANLTASTIPQSGDLTPIRPPVRRAPGALNAPVHALAVSLSKHPDQHRPEGPVLLAVDQGSANPRVRAGQIRNLWLRKRRCDLGRWRIAPGPLQRSG